MINYKVRASTIQNVRSSIRVYKDEELFQILNVVSKSSIFVKMFYPISEQLLSKPVTWKTARRIMRMARANKTAVSSTHYNCPEILLIFLSGDPVMRKANKKRFLADDTPASRFVYVISGGEADTWKDVISYRFSNINSSIFDHATYHYSVHTGTITRDDVLDKK